MANALDGYVASQDVFGEADSGTVSAGGGYTQPSWMTMLTGLASVGGKVASVVTPLINNKPGQVETGSNKAISTQTLAAPAAKAGFPSWIIVAGAAVAGLVALMLFLKK